MSPGFVDGLVERASRGAAGRLTRRSFLGRLGRLAVLLAAGPSIATLLADSAEGRVCGQTGVSPKCPTFDCDAVWGWCWYATGCCAGGKLKKICDCCAKDWPNVHGYCPAGTNVKCIVESCGTDPRVMSVALDTITADAAVLRADALRRAPPIDKGSRIVVADGSDELFALVAEAAANAAGVPSIRVGRDLLDEASLRAIERSGARSATIAGPELPATHDIQLTVWGLRVERAGLSTDVEAFSGEIASWVKDTVGARDAVCVAAAGLSGAMIVPAFRFARAMRLPLVVGVETPLAGAGAYLVGPEASVRASSTPGSRRTVSTQAPGVWNELASWLQDARGNGAPFALVPLDRPDVADALAMAGVAAVMHSPGNLDWAREWLFRHRAGAMRVWLPGDLNRFRPETRYELQSIMNGFEAHLLIGVAGQGLPVYSQPQAEREVGRARGGDEPPPPRTPGYWTRRGRRA